MKIQLNSHELILELDEKDIRKLSRKFSIKEKISFSFFDDDKFSISLKMDHSESMCLMYEDNELIIFVPYPDFEKWINAQDFAIRFLKENHPSLNLDVTIKKVINIPKIKTFGSGSAYSVSNSLAENNFNYN